MRRKSRAWTVVVAAATVGCAGPDPAVPAADGTPDRSEQRQEGAVGDTVEIALGATATLPGTTVDVTWLELVQDSRCPVGVDCVWAGDAEVLVRLAVASGTTEAVLHTGLDPRWVEIGGVEMELVDVLPRPVYGERPDPTTFRIAVRAR